MSIEFFEREEENPSLEFLPDALLENPKLDGKLFDVFSFKKAKSGKGYMVYTSDFICWFFKKEKPLIQALEALDYYCKTGTGFQFVVKVDKKLKSKFSLGIDNEREVTYVPLEDRSYLLAKESAMEDIPVSKREENPFIFKKPLPSLHPLITDQPNSGDTISPITPQGKKGREGTK